MSKRKKVLLSILTAFVGLFLLWWVYLIVDQNLNPPVAVDGRKGVQEFMQYQRDLMKKGKIQ